MKENNMIKLSFSFTDEFGQETNLNKIFTDEVYLDRTQLEFLIDEFKNFLIATGHSQTNVNKIQIVEE